MQYALINYEFGTSDGNPFYGRVLIKLKPSKYHDPLKKHYWGEVATNKYLDEIITYKNVKIYQELNKNDFIIIPIDYSDGELILEDDTIACLGFSTDENDEILEFDSDDDAKLWFEMRNL